MVISVDVLGPWLRSIDISVMAMDRRTDEQMREAEEAQSIREVADPYQRSSARAQQRVRKHRRNETQNMEH